MRNTPSFIGDFPKQKPKRPSLPPAELSIEKEANLRERKKKILQRLKKNVEQGGNGTFYESISRPMPSEDVPAKVIFSPKTTKRFLQVTQRFVESSSEDKIKRLEREKTPPIVLQKPLEKEDVEEASGREGYTQKKHSRNLNLCEELRNEEDISPSAYIPSFSEKPLRHLPESPSCTRKKDKVLETTIPLKKNYELEEASSSVNRKETSLQTCKSKAEVPVIITEYENTRESSVSDTEGDLEHYFGSPILRSASFHSLNKKSQQESRKIRTSAGKRRELLNVDDYGLVKSSSLSSLYNNSSAMLGDREGEPLSTSTPSFAKLQQRKLEMDFQRVEEDLDRAFSKLRKYLKTS